MNPEHTRLLKQLVSGHEVAALGTLHEGAPFVSMVPYAVSADGADFLCHVSGMASHTKDMRASPRVCLLVIASEEPGAPPQGRARVSLPGTARFVDEGSADFESFRRAYLERFPAAEELFGFPDFSLVAIRPESARFVAGFAQAFTLSADSLATALAARK